jgi:hypothetical protein
MVIQVLYSDGKGGKLCPRATRRKEALPWIYRTRDRGPIVEIGVSAKGNSCKEIACRRRRYGRTLPSTVDL